MSGLTKIALNYVFVALLHMDADGVAFSTVISNALSSSLILYALCHKENCCKIYLKQIRVTPDKLKRILSLGIPAGIQSATYGLAGSVVQASINSFGSIAVAGNGASQSIEVYAEAIPDSLGVAAMTFSAQNVGAKNYKRVKSVFIRANIFAALITCLFSAVTIPAREFLVGMFITDNPSAVIYGSERYISIISLQFINSLMSVSLITLRGIGRSFSAMIAALLGSCLTRIIWIMTVFKAFPSLKTIYAVYPVSWVITLVGCIAIFAVTYKKGIKQTMSDKSC